MKEQFPEETKHKTLYHFVPISQQWTTMANLLLSTHLHATWPEIIEKFEEGILKAHQVKLLCNEHRYVELN